MLFKRLGINQIARVIRNAPEGATAKANIINNLVLLFGEDNPLFDEKRFRQLCSGKYHYDPIFEWRERQNGI